MRPQIIYLKVKVKSLAAEARIIRREEQKAKDPELRSGLYAHRHNDVRTESRATQVAYGLIRGKRYSEIEPNAKTKPRWDKVKAMVSKYGTWEQSKAFEEWVKTVA